MILKPLKLAPLQSLSMKTIKISLIILFIGVVSNIYGQGITNSSLSNEEIFKFRVKQLTEFVDLFNNKVDFASRGISPEESQSLTRMSVMASLFDASDPRLDRDSESYDPVYAQMAKDFIIEVSNDDIYLTKSSEEIYAVANSSGTYKNKAVKFNIILQQELVGKDMLKWSISNVEAGFIDFLLQDSVYLRFLPPSSDELDFKELIRALNDHDYLDQYATKDFSYNALSVFFYLLKTGDVKMESILEVKYNLYEIPGWKIELSDFNRNSKNSGWLISDLKRI